ncbi:MAG: sigma-70 family RNA polymerase sigma factor [Roseburia sp.]|nr:sigma-70 family RNA polymerase sigma factor [Roseburia sp.]MCM1242824.1 sigma-70 family RNA polymerase sigma factor [Roseburia sp.]
MAMHDISGKRRTNDSALEEHYDKIYRYCFFKLRQREIAEDITQETFLHFLNHKKYRNIDKQLPYLYTIARHLCIDEYRRKKPLPLDAEEQLQDMAAEERMFDAVSVKIALAALTEEEREMILLRYVNEVPVAVICKMFGLSRYAVYRKTTKALIKLKEEVGY